jgi:hypothetical protein
MARHWIISTETRRTGLRQEERSDLRDYRGEGEDLLCRCHRCCDYACLDSIKP